MEKIKAKLKALFRKDNLRSTAITALLIGVVIAVNIIVYTLTAVFGLYLSPSAEDYDLSISGASDVLFEDALSRGKKVTVMFCRPEDEMPDDLAVNTDEIGIFYLTAEKFKERYNGLIDFEFVNIITHRNGDGEVVDLGKYQLKDDEGNSYPIYESTVVFMCEDRHKTVSNIISASFIYDANVSSTSYTAYCGEEVFASMVTQVLSNESSKKVQFTTLHSERIDSAFASVLSCAGYELDTVNLRRGEIAEDTDLIVISNPQTDFERSAEGSGVRSEIDKLREFVKAGGNIYVALDPYVEKLPSLEAFLKEFGISYSEREVDGKLLRDIVKDNDNAITMDKVTIVADVSSEGIGASVSEKLKEYEAEGIIISHSASLKLEGGASPLLVTSGSSSTYAGDKQTDKSGNYCIAATASYPNEENSGNILVVPSIYMTANDALYSSGYANREFLYAVTEEIFGVENVPIGCGIIHFNSGVLQNLTAKSMRVYTVLIFTIPAALAVLGTVVVVRRKNR